MWLPLLTASVWADTVTLNNGEKLEGKILRETAEGVVLEYIFSSSIVDERLIPRSEIATIKRELPDLNAFAEIESIPLPATALDPWVYDEIIAGKFLPFLKQYPYSAHCPAVRAKMAEFEVEKKRLILGELKLEGDWISDFRIKEEAYQLEARRTYDAQKAQFEKNNLVGSLNQFDKIEKTWPLSAVFPESVETAKLVLVKLDQLLTHELRNFPVRELQRRQTLERVPIERRPQVEAAQLAEKESAVASLAGVNQGFKFPPYSPLVKESMESLQRIILVEKRRLDLMDLRMIKTGIAEAQQATQLIQQNQLAPAATAVKNAEYAWPKMELLPRLKKRLNDALQAAAAGTQAQAKAVENAVDLKKQQSSNP